MGISINLSEIAEKVMADRGFAPHFPESVVREVSSIQAPAAPSSDYRDLRDFLWVSIDNDDSRDLDQITYAEKGSGGKDKVYIAIADVDALVKSGSSIDQYAAHNTTSVYTPTRIFPMLPLTLSTDLTSLGENADRCAIVVEVDVDRDGRFELVDIYPAQVRNHAKLTYNGVTLWLEKKMQGSPPRPEIVKQVVMQDQIARRIQDYRDLQGALTFGKIEVQPIVVGGVAIGLEEKVMNRAQKIIENFMIAANVATTSYLLKQRAPIISRIVRVPERWDRVVELAKALGHKLPAQPDVKALQTFLLHQQRADPEHFSDLSLAMIKLIGKGEYVLGVPGEPPIGHFDLALRDYAHATAPNRRYPDLIMQRILKSCIFHKAIPYTSDELSALAHHCTEKEDDAAKVERRMHKSAAAMVLSERIGETFSAMVTGAGIKGTWVRLLKLPIEGKLVEGFEGFDVGDHLTVKLVHVDIANGYIDFAKIHHR